MYFISKIFNIKNLKQRKICAMLMGCLATASTAPLYFTFCLVFSLTILYELIASSEKALDSFCIGIYFGLGFFATSLYWIIFFFDLEFAQSIWLVVLILLVFFLSTYTGLFALSFYLSPKKNIIIFAALFTFFEILRGNLFTGFPWNYLSYSWMNSNAMMQLFSVFGAEGMIFFTVAYSTIPIIISEKIIKKNLFFYASGLLIMTISFIWGSYRVINAPHRNSDIKLRLVQSGIKSNSKWNEDFAMNLIHNNIALSRSNAIDDIDYIIWPESSVQFLIDNEAQPFIDDLLTLLPKTLIIGANRKDESSNVFNSMLLLKDKKIIDHYDKIKLIPLGEFSPFNSLFTNKEDAFNIGGYSSGRKNGLINIDHPFYPYICYESIFTGINKDANWLVNITNDSRFGFSNGPHQHFAMARARAVEYGLAMARVASNGITAMIDPYGRIIDMIELDKQGIIDVYLPNKASSNTIYSDISVYLHYFFLFLGVSLLVWIAYMKIKMMQHNFNK